MSNYIRHLCLFRCIANAKATSAMNSGQNASELLNKTVEKLWNSFLNETINNKSISSTPQQQSFIQSEISILFLFGLLTSVMAPFYLCSRKLLLFTDICILTVLTFIDWWLTARTQTPITDFCQHSMIGLEYIIYPTQEVITLVFQVRLGAPI